jgi:hypothetical protein
VELGGVLLVHCKSRAITTRSSCNTVRLRSRDFGLTWAHSFFKTLVNTG